MNYQTCYQRLIAVFMLAGVMFATGCSKSGSDRISVYPVRGRILGPDGKPAEGVRVFLYPTAAPMVPDVPQHPNGVTGFDGQFTLSTFAKDDGAAEGSYQILLMWPKNEPGEEEGEAESDRLFGWFDLAHSKLAVTVTSQGAEIPVIKLPSVSGPPPESQGIPGRN